MPDSPWLPKLACWAGALADAYFTVALLIPRLWGFSLGEPGFAPSPEVRSIMAVAASLMAGWTGLLIWAARAPVPRRGVLLLTACPVLAGLIATGIVSAATGVRPAAALVPTWILQAVLGGLMVAGWWSAARTRPQDPAAHNTRRAPAKRSR